jgi:PAS domain S-box-containing protein
MRIKNFQQAEVTLQDKEEQFQSAISNIPGAIYRCACDSDWRIIFISDAIASIAGFPATDFIDNKVRTFASIIHPEDRARVRIVVQQGVEAQKPYTIEYRIIHADSSVRWVYEKGQGILGEDGRLQWLDGAIFDISDAVAAATQRKQLEQDRDRFFNLSLDLLAIVDFQGYFQRVNPIWSKVLGYTSQELSSRPFIELVHPEDREKTIAEAQKVLTGTESIGFENRYRCKDGSYKWLLWNATAYPEQQVTYAIARDITSTKQVEAKLQESEHKFRNLYEATGDAVMLLNEQGFFDCNPATLAMFACTTKEDFCGKHIGDFSPPNQPCGKDSLSFAQEQIAIALAEGSCRFEWLHQRCDGSEFPTEVLLTAIEIDQKKVLQAVVRDITSRKKALAALHEERERFRWLSNATFEGIAVHEQGKILDANQALATMLGYEVAELIGTNGLERFTPESRDIAIKNMMAGYEKPYEAVGLRKDGSTFPVELQGKTIIYQGRQVRLLAVRDITSRKQAEAALRESEERFRAIAEATPVPTLITRVADGRILYANQSLGPTFGLDSAEMIGRKIPDFYYDPAQRQCLLDLLQRDGYVRNYESRAKKADGTPFWVVVSICFLTFNGEEALLTTFYDTTERKQAEEALRQSEEQWRAIAEAVPNPVFISRVADGRILYANAQVLSTFGLSADEVIGYKTTELYYNASDRQRLLELLSKDGHISNSEVRGKKVDGTLIWFAISIRYITFNGEQVLVGALYNITERKLAEAGLMERSRLSTLAAEVGVALGQNGILCNIMNQCTETIVRHLEASVASIWTLNPATKVLEQQALAIAHPPLEDFATTINFGNEIVSFIANPTLPYLSASYKTEELGSGGGEIGAGEEFSSSSMPNNFSGYPLIVEERLVGAIAVLSDVEITTTVHSTLGWVANAIALAIDRAWAREELLSRREALLFDLASQIRNSLDLDTILETAVVEIRNLLQIDCCEFMWFRTAESENISIARQETTENLEEEAIHTRKIFSEAFSRDRPNGQAYWEIVKESKNYGLSSFIGSFSASSVAPLGDKLLNLEIVRIDDVQTLREPGLRQLLIYLGKTALVSLPLQTYTGQIGVITCGHCNQARLWSDSEVELLQAVTMQLAIAIDQAELYTQARNSASLAQAQSQQLEQALLQLQQTQTQLIQTEKMSSLGQMVAGIAHEINNPVTFIHGNLGHARAYIKDLLSILQLYQEHYPEPVREIQQICRDIDLDFVTADLPKVLSSMQIGADRIQQIVLSLRNFSRLDEAGMKPVDIHEGIDNTLLILQHRLKPKSQFSGINIVKEYGELPPVECYAGQLNQVFMNIIGNAIDALESQPEPRIITICTEVKSGDREGSLPNPDCPTPNNTHVAIRIKDNGPGMTEQVKKRLFDPFFTTKPVGKGTGLGLSISHHVVVEKHGGTLQCVSQPGEGAEFWIQIPVAAAGEGSAT